MKQSSSKGSTAPRPSEGSVIDPVGSGLRSGGTLQRTALFLALFATMQGLYSWGQGGWFERLIINHITVQPAAWIIDTLSPHIGVEAAGSRLRAPGGGINVLNGCEGVDIVFLLTAAMLVAPLSWRRKLAGIGVGAILVMLLNQARVVALFYTYRSDQNWFDMLHGVLTPLLLIALAGGFFAFWLGYAPGGRKPAKVQSA